MKPVLSLFALFAVAANLLVAQPVLAQNKKPVEKKHVAVAQKHVHKKIIAKKVNKHAHVSHAKHTKKK